MKNRYQENTAHLNPRNDLNIKPQKRNKSKLLKFQINSSIGVKPRTLDYRRKISSDRNFYNAKSSIPDEKALIRKKPQKKKNNTTSNHHHL
jgi:hypothetical protein